MSDPALIAGKMCANEPAALRIRGMWLTAAKDKAERLVHAPRTRNKNLFDLDSLPRQYITAQTSAFPPFWNPDFILFATFFRPKLRFHSRWEKSSRYQRLYTKTKSLPLPNLRSTRNFHALAKSATWR